MSIRSLVLVLTALAITLSFVHAPYPSELALQHAPTVPLLVAFAFANRLWRPTLLSFACIITFFALHIFGARWIYTYVPYDAVSEALLGRSLSDFFGWQRNHYDRLVHLAFGLVGVPPLAELFQRSQGMRCRSSAIHAMSAVLAMSAVYEIIEWQVAMVFAADYAESYNGQQGDVWDPQKDMALAGLGALIAATLTWRWQARSPAP